MKTQTRTGAGGRRARLGNEGGFLLVMVMVVMLALSAIAASTLINSFLERSLAKNQNYSSVALQAAEAGLAAGSTWLRSNQGLIPSATPWADDPGPDGVAGTADDVWPKTLTGTVFTDGEGRAAQYTVTMRYKREWRDVSGDDDATDPGESSGYEDGCDVNGDGDCTDPGELRQIPDDGTHAPDSVNGLGETVRMELLGDIVLYNKCSGRKGCFNFPDSPFAGTGSDVGFPVAEIDAVGTFGESSYRQVALDVARNKLNARGVHGGITAKGSVAAMGTADIDGRNYNEAGTAFDTSCADKPGAFVETGQTATYNNIPHPSYSGNPPTVVNPAAGLGHETLYTTPWEALDIDEADMPAPVSAATASAMLLNPAMEGEIVYVSGDYTPPDGAHGLLVVHNPAGNAVFSTAGTLKFTGLIIADAVEIHGTADIVGAVISMSTVTVDVSAGTPYIRYSCAAINRATRQAYSNKLGWHRLR
jgi:Tfp pilus assembly protein PilX